MISIRELLINNGVTPVLSVIGKMREIHKTTGDEAELEKLYEIFDRRKTTMDGNPYYDDNLEDMAEQLFLMMHNGFTGIGAVKMSQLERRWDEERCKTDGELFGKVADVVAAYVVRNDILGKKCAVTRDITGPEIEALEVA